jgi:predicted  nucleic acid-binding Zn-ribbon protein
MEDLQQELNFLQERATDKREEIDNFEIDVDDKEEQFNDMLDECYEELFNMLPSRILKECDPIQYREGLNDYVDSLEVSDEPEYKELEEELEGIEDEIQALQDEIEELQDEEE